MDKCSFKIIGISGVGRAGKDSFYRFASEFLSEQGITFGRWAFADELKKDLDQFISEKFGFSAFTEITEEKNKVRPLMVEYGKIRRNESRGQYWINKIKPTILAEDGPQVRFITDLRFAKFKETDELAFVKNNFGSIIHVARYQSFGPDYVGENQVIEPANEEERENDPIVRQGADIKFRWSDYIGVENGEETARNLVFSVMRENAKLWRV